MSKGKISDFLNSYIGINKKIKNTFIVLNQKKYLLNFFFLAVFFVLYALILNQVKFYTKLKENNFDSFLKSNEFSNIKEFIFENEDFCFFLQLQ